MADDINYDYPAMDGAYEDFLHVNKQVVDESTLLEETAHNILGGMAGAVIDGYEGRFKALLQQVTDSNDWLASTSRGLQDAFNAMGHADIKLGDGFVGPH